MEVTKFNIYDSTEYNSCQEEARVWEETHGPYYKGVMCLKPLDGGCTKKTIEEAHAKIEPFISNTLEEVMEKKQSPLCVLPQNHHGKWGNLPGSSDPVYDRRNVKILYIRILSLY